MSHLLRHSFWESFFYVPDRGQFAPSSAIHSASSPDYVRVIPVLHPSLGRRFLAASKSKTVLHLFSKLPLLWNASSEHCLESLKNFCMASSGFFFLFSFSSPLKANMSAAFPLPPRTSRLISFITHQLCYFSQWLQLMPASWRPLRDGFCFATQPGCRASSCSHLGAARASASMSRAGSRHVHVSFATLGASSP